MTVFLFWTGLLVLSISIYLFLLWRKQRKTPFRIKLTILFLSFVLLPTIPLLFINAQLVTQSARVLLMPGYEEALTQSLESIRTLSEDRGRIFLKTHPNPSEWLQTDLKTNDISLVAWQNINNPSDQSILISSKDVRSQTVLSNLFLPGQNNRAGSKIIKQDTTFYILISNTISDSLLCTVGYPLSGHILDSRNQIERSLQIYSTVIMMKDVILQKEIIWLLAFIFLFILVLISVQVAKKTSKTIHEPIQEMVSEMGKVQSGNLDVQIQTKASGEFRFLIDEFNQMIRDLKESREKLIESEKLAAWRDVARRMSHEIKNTLGPMMLSLRQLRTECDETRSAKIESHLNILDSEFQGMKSMAENFSTFAKMPKPQLAPVQLNASVQYAVDYLSPMYPEIEFKISLENQLQTVQADHQQINRVLINLIKNGIDASNGKGVIQIRTNNIDEQNHLIYCEIIDKGSGISKENLDKIMSPYFTTKAKGTGLGLSIVKQIIEDHGGILNVKSDYEKGTTFSFSI